MTSLPPDTAVVIVDHGSKRAAANEMLEAMAALYRRETGVAVVESAHMELAEPSIPQAIARCVEQGARQIVVSLFFLSPGRHSTHDIPRMVEQAAQQYPGVTFRVSAPLGLDAGLAGLLHQRVLAAAAPASDSSV